MRLREGDVGLFDSVRFKCTKCADGHVNFQSKEGPCNMEVYDLEKVPVAVVKDIDGHTASCDSCDAWYVIRSVYPIPETLPMFVKEVET